MQRPFTRIGAVVFGIVGVAHLLRLILHFPVVINGILLPLWVNEIGLLIAGLLAVLLWREARQ